MLSLQEQYSPQNRCFGCGPSNEKGLRIRSFAQGDEVVADWTPEAHHLAFDNMLNGGICGSLLDCHCNWTAAYHLMKARHEQSPPCTVTAEYTIKLLKPTPMNTSLHLQAKVVEATDKKAWVEGTLSANGEITATCRGLFVAVREGHPAFHRW